LESLLEGLEIDRFNLLRPDLDAKGQQFKLHVAACSGRRGSRMKSRFTTTFAENMDQYKIANMATKVAHGMWYTILDMLEMAQRSSNMVAHGVFD
jgi:hypothetical protein